MTFHNFDIPTLLDLCNVCKLFQQIATEVLSKKFQEPKIGLMLTFEQEHKWKFNIPFEFGKFNEQSGNFIFEPIKSRQSMRFIHSSMVRSPVLSKVTITGINGSSNHHDGEPHEPNVNTNHPSTPSTTSSSSSSTIKPKKFEENFLQNSLTLGIKSHKDILKKTRHVYRMGHGTSHLKIPYTFTYSVSETPPPSFQRTRGGERWLTPLSFECAPSFFYPREPIAHQILMTIIHLRKKNSPKKKSSNPPSTNNNLSKQKQKAVDIEQVEDVISIDLNMDGQENLNPTTYKRLFEKQMNQQEHLLFYTKRLKESSKRWVRGARS